MLNLEDEPYRALLKKEPPLINVGTGEDLTIQELAGRIAALTHFTGRIAWDASKPDGTPRKLLDVSRMQALGWRARTSLDEGLQRTLEAYRASLTAS